MNFDILGDIGSLFQVQSSTPFLASIGDHKYYPHLLSQFNANLGLPADTLDSYLLGVDMTFDEVLIGQLLKIPSSRIDITLSVEELGLTYLEINKTISLNKKSTFIPNKINQLSRIARIIAYILAANIIQKKGHFDELSSMTCKMVYAIMKKIPVNWCRHPIFASTR